MSKTSSIPILLVEKNTAMNNAAGAINLRYESAGNPGRSETERNEAAFTEKKKMGIKKLGIKAKNGRQICLMFRMER